MDDASLVVNDSGVYNPETRTITWFIGELQSKEKGSVSFSVNVKENVPDLSEVINFATVYFPSVPEITRTNGTVNHIITGPLDTTPPVTTISVSPSPNPAGWNNTDVNITLTAIDNLGGSGVTETHYILSGAQIGEGTVSSNAAQISISPEGITNLTYWTIDNAGNAESAKIVTVKIDKTPPEILINVPKNLEAYLLNQTIFCDWSAQDLLSGIDSISTTAPNQAPINLVSIGPKTFNIVASDKAGNQRDISVTYRVIYNFSGILPPIESDGSSVFKLGSTIPIKFQLKDAQGNFITNAIAKISMQKFSNSEPIGEPIEAVSTASSTTGNLFRYDASENQYIFNFSTKTLSTGLWQLKIELDDGEKYSVFVGLK